QKTLHAFTLIASQFLHHRSSHFFFLKHFFKLMYRFFIHHFLLNMNIVQRFILFKWKRCASRLLHTPSDGISNVILPNLPDLKSCKTISATLSKFTWPPLSRAPRF